MYVHCHQPPSSCRATSTASGDSHLFAILYSAFTLLLKLLLVLLVIPAVLLASVC